MDPQIKKQALRMFTYGLYAVSCIEGDEVNAFTANWLSQVSFEPPLVAVSIENASKSLPMILRTRKLAINVLRSGQRELAGALGRSALKNPDKMKNIAYDKTDSGYIVLREALAWVACEIHQTMETGDSTLVVAQVVDAGIIAEGQPLSMADAGFRHAG